MKKKMEVEAKYGEVEAKRKPKETHAKVGTPLGAGKKRKKTY